VELTHDRTEIRSTNCLAALPDHEAHGQFCVPLVEMFVIRSYMSVAGVKADWATGS
jgi:hypothetical protein